MSSPHRLGHYIRHAFDEIGLPTDDVSFEGPFLRQKGINRILFYPGTFNPPHKGHRDLLAHSFANAGDDLHIAAAIILPTDDERLELKMSSQQYTLKLNKFQRAALLRNSALQAQAFLIFDHSEEDWRRFRAALMSVFQQACIEVKLVMLGGPDWIKMEAAHDPAYWDCADALICDVSRPVNFRYPSCVAQIAGHTQWEKPSVNIDRLRGQMRGKMRGQNPKAIEAAVHAAVARIEAVWDARRLRKPKGFIRFIPADLSQQPTTPPSSTRIREIIATCPDEKLVVELKEWALSAELLAEYVQDFKARGETFIQAPVEKPSECHKVTRW